MAEKRVQVIVKGEVQGVGFRAHCQRQAAALGVTGWVRNRWDGSVEALCTGPAAAVDALVAWCQHGPPSAEVTDVQVADAPPGSDYRSFSINLL